MNFYLEIAYLNLFFSFSNSFKLFSGVDKFSSIVLWFFLIVSLIFLHISYWVLLALFSPIILSSLKAASVWVILNKLVPNSSLPILSKISSLYLNPFLLAISLAVSPLYRPLYPLLWNLSKFLTPAFLATIFKE